MHLRFITALISLFIFSSALSHPVSGHNTPILLNLSSYHSLDPYQKTVQGNIKLHLTLVFTQMSNEMIADLKDSLEEQLRNPYQLGKMVEDIKLDFKEFGLLANNLVAFYVPNDWNSYRELIGEIRHLVREIAGQMGNLTISQKNDVEHGRIGQETVYTMDIRNPIPHLSLKYLGTTEEVQKLNALWQNGLLQKPKSLTIRVNQIEIQITRAIQL